MVDAAKIFSDLEAQAREVLENFDVEAKVDDARAAADRVRERLETDPQARTAAAGAGGLLLLGLLGTRGGRSFLGGVAKTGAVAALGALAYKTWNEKRQGGSTPPPDFLVDAQNDPAFANAVVRAMLAGAWSDGVFDAREKSIIEGVLAAGDLDQELGALLHSETTEAEDLDFLIEAATTPNRAAQLFAAASLTADPDHPQTKEFLERLADALGLSRKFASTPS